MRQSVLPDNASPRSIICGISPLLDRVRFVVVASQYLAFFFFPQSIRFPFQSSFYFVVTHIAASPLIVSATTITSFSFSLDDRNHSSSIVCRISRNDAEFICNVFVTYYTMLFLFYFSIYSMKIRLKKSKSKIIIWRLWLLSKLWSMKIRRLTKLSVRNVLVIYSDRFQPI